MPAGLDAESAEWLRALAHLQACGPCGEDFAGLLAAIRGQAH